MPVRAAALGAFLTGLWLCVAGALWAQSTEIDYLRWDGLATRAEEVLEQGRASSAALETLRSDLAEFRARLLAAQGDNAERIDTLRAQLSALGDAPEDGSEPPEITERRVNLAEQLSRLQAPLLRAQEGYTRADGLIREIDAKIRTRQVSALLDIGPSPFEPQHWPTLISEVRSAFKSLYGEVQDSLGYDLRRAEMRAQMPLILLLLVAAVVLILRGGALIAKGEGMVARARPEKAALWSFLLSLGHILLPYLGVLAIQRAILVSDLTGPRGLEFVQFLDFWALVYFGTAWLANLSFDEDDSRATVRLANWRRVEARSYLKIIAFVLVLSNVFVLLSDVFLFPEDTYPALDFPFLVICGLMLFRLGIIFRGLGEGENSTETIVGMGGDNAISRVRILRLLGRAMMLVAVIGPLMAAIGYFNAGNALVYPMIKTLTLVLGLLAAQKLANLVFTRITGGRVQDSESLVPVFVTSALTLGALPILALVWGARVADLTELWSRFREGFMLGDTRISPTDFLVFAVVFAIGYTLTRLLQGGLRGSVLPKTKLDPGAQTALVSGAGYLGIFLAALVAITTTGVDLSSVAIVAGALSVGIGFGLQNIVQNFVSGIILLIERPISEGDWIEVGGQHGTVKDISVRSTRIETFDRYDLIVPNADLVSGQVRNYTKGNVLGRIIVPVGVAYGTDTRHVEKILRDIARAHDMVLMNPAPSVDFIGFGADSLDFQIRVVLRDITQGMAVRTEMRHQIVERFAEEGIEIPFAQRDLWLRNPEALRQALAEKQAKEAGEEDA